MTTTPVLIPIPNLGAGTDPPNPAADLVAVSQSGVARKLTINELLDGAHPVNWTVDYLTVIHDATVGGTLGVTGTGTFAGSLIAGNAGTAPITLQSGIISMPASQSLQIRLATAGQTVGIGAPAPGLGQALTITPNTDGNNAFGALPNDVAVNNRLTFTSARTIGGTYALSGTVTPTAITGNGATITITFPIISGIVLTVGSSVTLSGVTPSGYNGTRTILTASNTQVTLSGSTTGTVTVLGSMTYNLLSPQVLNVSSSWSGTPIAGVRFAPYRFLISSDTTATDGTGQGAAAMEIAHNWLGAATGGKLGMQVSLSHTGATNDTGSQQHVVANLHGQSFFNAGGTGTGSLAHGTFYGLNPQIRLNSGATYWNLVNVLGEVDLAVNASQQNINLGGTVTAGNVVTLTFASADIVGSPVAVSWTLGAGQTLPMVANNLAAAVNANAALRNAKIGATGWEGALRIYYYTHISTLTITPSVSGGATITAALGTFTSGASTSFKTMASFIRLADDDAPGSSGSALMIFGTQYSPSPSGQFEAGIAFNGQPAYHGSWSFTQNATLIGSNLTTGVGNLDKSSPILSNTAGFGVDWQLVNFTRATNGRAFRSSNFGVGGEGNIYSGGAVIAPTSAGLSIDVTGRTASSVALAAGGGGGSGQVIGNYFIGDIGFDDYNGQYRVTGVNASTGAVTTFAVESPPSYSSGSAPANPITVNGGSGRNWTVNATWPSAASLSFQASGGNSLFGGTITIGNTTPLVGGSKFFRFGYGATNPLVVMQSAGTDAAGSGQQVLSVSQQVNHSGAGAAAAIGALYSASTIDGAPYTDYYAGAMTMTNRALRLGGATADEAQHGTLFTHQVKDLPTGGFNPGDIMSDSWVQWWVIQDRTNLPSSTGGALVGVEFDIFGNNADDAASKKRFARQVVLNNYAHDALTPLEWGYGDYWNSFTGGINDTFFNVVSAYYAGWTVAGIDMSQGTGSRANPYIDGINRGVAIKFADGVKFGWNGDGATGVYTTHGSNRLQFWNNGSEIASISDTGTGTFTGSVVVSGYVDYSVGNALTAAGTTRADALQLAKQVNRVTTAAASTGVVLPVGVVGMRITVFNAGANPIKVYASASETVDGTAGSTGVTLTNALRCDYFFVAANTWVSAQLGAVSA